MCKCVQPPGDNPIAVNKYININKLLIYFTVLRNLTRIFNKVEKLLVLGQYLRYKSINVFCGLACNCDVQIEASSSKPFWRQVYGIRS
jgi:hypothetical protein